VHQVGNQYIVITDMSAVVKQKSGHFICR